MKKTISTFFAVITILVLTLCSSSWSNEKLHVTPKEPLARTFLAKSVEGIDITFVVTGSESCQVQGRRSIVMTSFEWLPFHKSTTLQQDNYDEWYGIIYESPCKPSVVYPAKKYKYIYH